MTLKASKTLNEKITGIATIILPEAYTEEIQDVLSAAKAPKKDGKGYRYPTMGGVPFEGVSMTNGRKVIRNLIYSQLLAT